MPIYEFYSPDTHRIYSFYARRILSRDVVPLCPDGESFAMERMMSSFAFTGRAKEAGGEGGDSPDAKQVALMQEAMQAIEKMGDSEPDARVLGAVMRKLQTASGEKLPAGMEEMIRRMEAGEDLEKLEAEYEDFPEDEGVESGAGGRRKAPHRDPKLYEMSEFLV
ncbi:MAG: cytochrome C [Chthoniobacterales bacterium]